MPRVLSVWLPAWPIERLERSAPGSIPVEHPFALVEKGVHGLIVGAVNAGAHNAGVQVGEKLTDVRARMPDVHVRPAELARDATALERLARWLGRYGPRCNVEGRDGIWIDITGVAHLFGGETPLLIDLVRRLRAFGVTARVGLADTPRAAAALARFCASGSAPFVAAAPDRTREALAELPVAALALEADVVALLRRLGLKRIGQLYGLPRPALARRFRGKLASAGSAAATPQAIAATVLVRLDQALGLLAEPRRALEEPPQTDVRLPCPEPLVSAEGVEAALEHLAGRLMTNLAAAALGARRFRLTLYRSDGTWAQTAVATSAPCREAAHICRLMGEKITNLDAGFGIDLLVLGADDVAPVTAHQVSLAGARGSAAAAHASRLIDRLSSRLGAERVQRLVRRASHIPERAQIRVPMLAARAPPLVDADLPRHGSRPAFLLEPPEPITVMAEVPEGAPMRLQWRRVHRRVVRAEGPERIAPEWWRSIDMAEEKRPRTRDYYRLEDETGAGYWVFREGLMGRDEDEAPRWFMHGLFA
jgi:protein ImuB